MAGWRAGAALCLLGSLAASVALADGLNLYHVPVRTLGAIEEGEAPLHVAILVRDPQRLAAGLPGATLRGDAVELELAESRTLPGAPEARHRAASFVVDWQEPAVQALRAALVAEHGERPSLDALRDFTEGAIPRKTMERGWDLASVVARSGVGDCTEHAILLAALARALGRPARVVLGVLLVLSPESVTGFGHAWAEIHDGDAWRAVDATPVASQGRVRYLPFTALEDESAGYTLALTSAMQAVWVREIEVRGSR